MIEAVIWDFGGVFTSSPFEAFARYERERGLPENLIRQINAANHLENAWAKFERAEIDLDGFDEEFAAEARALGHDVPGRDIIPLLAGDFRPEMIEALRRIRAARIQDRLHHQQCAVDAGGRRRHAGQSLQDRDHGAVRSSDRKLQGGPAQARSENLCR